MNTTPPSQLTTLRQLLQSRLRDLRADLQAEDIDVAAQGGEVSDSKDAAMHQQFAAVRDAEERRDIDELVCVEAALHRLDNGTYGECLGCGEPIAMSRLMVQPAALRCAACQSALERARAARGT